MMVPQVSTDGVPAFMTPLYFLGVGFEVPKLEPLPPPVEEEEEEMDPDDLLLYGPLVLFALWLG